MSKIGTLFILAIRIGLCLCLLPGMIDEPSWNRTDETCEIESILVLKTVKSDKFVNGKDTINLVWSRKYAFYKEWNVEAGLGWFILRNRMNGGGTKLLNVKGGCDNAKPGTKLILRRNAVAGDHNKFVFNSDGTIQSLCSNDLYLKVDRGYIVLAQIDDPSTSSEQIRFLLKP